MVKMNGIEYDAAGETLAALLAAAHYDFRKIAVERNGDVVPKVLYEKTVLQEGDALEVVCFVGGG